MGSSALLGAPMPSDLVMGSGGGGRSKSSQEESGGGHEDENGVDDSAAFNAELDRIAAEKEQVSSEAWMLVTVRSHRR